MRAPITSIEKLSVVNSSGAIVRYTYDVEISSKYLGRRVVRDVPEELATRLRVGEELECNGVEL